MKLNRSFSETNKFVAGGEVEHVGRIDQSVVLLNRVRQLADFGSELNLSTRRYALYAQDEWDPAKDWSANLGARWESIATKSNADAVADGGTVDNRSSVFSPLAHLVWRVNAPKKDQVRLSLTQSYQSPSRFSLIPRPRLDSTYPVPGPNTAIFPDYAGNPALRPERANGIDLGFEHYPEGGGVVAINLFRRQIRDLVRGLVLLETVPWASSPRYVFRNRNIGKAVSSGIEFDAKAKLSEWYKDAPAVELHANVSVFDSKVDSVNGPNNRINDQPRGRGNVGADYKIGTTAFTVGATVSYTPSYTIQNTNTQVASTAASRNIDAYLLWAITPKDKLRLTISNLVPIDASSSSALFTDTQRQGTVYTARSYATIALRLEMRL
ncbi:MAG: TonB-dependent receptor [Betaproteobacteria bacterium]|nr:TonB-dependent receptor [Betaproteobacteria bacterium]